LDGLYFALGMIYSETTNSLFVSRGQQNLNCVQEFDLDLNDLGVAVGPGGETGVAKGIAIIKECCPENNNITVDTLICSSTIGDTIFLQEILSCNGVFSEGVWVDNGGKIGMTYNDCNASITLDLLDACGSFTLSSDGTGDNAQCDAFTITLNINVQQSPEATVFAIQPSCSDGEVNNDGYLQISEITSGKRFNWSMSNSYTGDTTYANAIDTTGLTFPLQFATGQMNPSGAQDYTVRVFSDFAACEGNCFTDYVVTMQEQNCSTGCECTEYIYLNEVAQGGIVHKFEVLSNGLLDEVLVDGNPWYQNLAAGERLYSPHGLGTDLNGFLYIGENGLDAGHIRKFDCDGNVFPLNEFGIKDTYGPLNEQLPNAALGSGGFQQNLFSIGNTIFNNANSGPVAHNLCTQEQIGQVCLQGADPLDANLWGLSYTKETGMVYASSLLNGNEIWVFDTTQLFYSLYSGACIDPLTTLPGELPYGIVGDLDKNIYVITSNIGADNASEIIKLDSLGNEIARTGTDMLWSRSIGLAISNDKNTLYVSAYSQSLATDCIAVFDTDLNYLGQGAAGQGNLAKAIAINKECCPTANNIVIDTTLCNTSIGDRIFLQELISCEGTICSGVWDTIGTSTGLVYDGCDNSLSINAQSGCGTYALNFDGTGNNAQCGAFTITVNVTIVDMEFTVNQTECTDNGNGTFTTSYDAVVDWAVESCGDAEIINVSHNGNIVGVINTNVDTSPTTFSINVEANGLGTQSFKAEFQSDVCSAKSFSFKTPIPCPSDVATCTSTSGCLGGNAFEDFNCNGIDDIHESGVQGVQVVIYDCDNNVVDSVWTDSDGDWQTCGLTDGAAHRVEFNLPESLACWATPTHSGSDNGTDVQFLTVPACTKFSLSSPTDYCQENPMIATACFVAGDPTDPTGEAAALDALVLTPYNATDGTENAMESIHTATAGEIGSVWGVAYQRKSKQMFSSAFLKRHIGFSSAGLGAIFITDLATMPPTFPGSSSLYLNLDDYGINTGNESILNRDLPSSGAGLSYDSLAFDYVGKMGLGDLQLGAGDSVLWTINLFKQELIRITIPKSAQAGDAIIDVSAIAIPNPGCVAASDWRPFGLEYYRGKLYVGGVCSGQSTQDTTDMTAHIYEYDEVNQAFYSILSFALDYPRGTPYTSAPAELCDRGWRPWATNWEQTAVYRNNKACLPQPILSDIEFDANGHMLLAFADRYGHQGGWFNYTTNRHDPRPTDVYKAYSGGDLLKAFNVDGTFILENNASGGDEVSAYCATYNDSDGPGGKEFFCHDRTSSVHSETFHGSLLMLPDLNQLVAIRMNPVDDNSGGLVWLDALPDPSDREKPVKGYELYDSDQGTLASAPIGKATGLGDIELTCAPAPLEIGNYVWCDSIENGIQDACEKGVNDLIVQLYSAAGILVGQDTTVNGNYYFNQKNVDTIGIEVDGLGVANPSTNWSGLNYNSKYYLVFANGQYDHDDLFIIDSEYYSGVTMANVNGDSNDKIDSDADGGNLSTAMGTMPANLPFICINTASTGCGDHQYDLGLTCPAIYDWGDLPDTSSVTGVMDYQTDSINGGPSHQIIEGLFLGWQVDFESDGQQSTDALGDGADEDGTCRNVD